MRVVQNMNEIISALGDESTLSIVASWVTILSLAAAPPVYFIQRWHNHRSETKRASNNLCRELQDTFEGLNMEIYKQDSICFTIPNGQSFFYMNRTLNHDFYDSLVFSGKINFLQPELQQPIQNIFNQIKTHNEYIKLIREISERFPNKDLPEYSYRYFEWLENNEIKLLKDIPSTITMLEKKFHL